MLLRIFKGSGPGVIFLIIFTLIAVWISAFLNPSMESVIHSDTDQMPLYSLITLAVGQNHTLSVFFSLLIVSLMAFLLVNFNTSEFFINERTFLPALIYILFCGLFPKYQVLNPVLPASLFLMLAIRRIMDGYRIPGIAYNFFDAGILISTGSLFYANLIWFGLLVIIGILLLRTVNILEIAVSILGLATPYFIAFGMYFVIGRELKDLLSIIQENLFGRPADYLFTRLTIVAIISAALIICVSIVYLIMVMNTKKIKSRKTFFLLIWVFLISIGVYFILPSASVELVWLLGIPVSYFLTHYFVFIKKKIVPEIFFSVFFILILLIQIWYLK
jgi:hypothetical protein